MAGFSSTADYVDAHEAGQTFYSTWRKSPSQATSQGIWVDLSMSPGNPVPNYYASSPLIAATLNGAEGLPHGGSVSPQTKHLERFMALTATVTALPLYTVLADYLLYYPFVDTGTNDEQTMTNTVTLPRYADGEGVQVMAVVTNSPSAPSGLTFTFDYVNQDGVAKTSPTNGFGAGTTTGSLATTDRAVANTGGAFLKLATGDTGIQQITAFRMLAGLDVGLICLVLVKPLATHILRGIDAPVERDFLTDFPSVPRILDGAYLGLITCPSGTLAATAIHGSIETVWS